MITFLSKYIIYCACILIVCANTIRDNEMYRLDIIHYNDFHDRFEETSVAYPLCKSNDTSCIGGFARLYHEIQELLQQKPDALVLNAGDTFQGTYWYSLLKWNISQKFINMIPNDAHALGNHEFDDGEEGLVPYIKALKAPVVAANIQLSKNSQLDGLFKPYVIIERKGRKIGVIGLITTKTRSAWDPYRYHCNQLIHYFNHIIILVLPNVLSGLTNRTRFCRISNANYCARDLRGLTPNTGDTSIRFKGFMSKSEKVLFIDPVPVVQEQAKLLTDQGVDIIVVLSHCGLDVDQKIAKQVGENIDIIVGGHTHSLLWNGVPPSEEEVVGPYPVLIESDANPGHKVLIVTASAFSKYLGNISLYFNQQGELLHFEGEPIFLNRSIPEDPRIKAMLQPHADQLHQLVNEKIGSLAGDMSIKTCRSQECAIGNLIADAFWTATNKTHPSERPIVALLHSNSIRTSLLQGVITRGAIINIMPFTNKIVTFTIQGRHLKDALSTCVRNPWVLKPYAGPHTPMISGLKLTINTTSAQVLEALLTSGGEEVALDPDQDYQVTTMDFLAYVGFEFKKYGRDLKVVGKDIAVIESFIRQLSPITPYLDNRLNLVS